MAFIIPNFLVLHQGENFMRILTKIAKLPLHENLHKNVNENMNPHAAYGIFLDLICGRILAPSQFKN